MMAGASAFNLALHARERLHQDTWGQARAIPAFPQTKHGWQLRGWPDKLTPGMVAALQEPRDDEKRCAIWSALLQECSNGTLECFAPKVLRSIDGEFYTVHSLVGDGKEFSEEVLPLVRQAFGNMRPVPDEMLPHMHRLSFTTVGEWLRDTGRVPSGHIAAWFAACGFVLPGGGISQVRRHSAKGRGKAVISQVVDDAIAECRSDELARVWTVLVRWATEGRDPFTGVKKSALTYRDPVEKQYDRDALRAYLGRRRDTLANP